MAELLGDVEVAQCERVAEPGGDPALAIRHGAALRPVNTKGLPAGDHDTEQFDGSASQWSCSPQSSAPQSSSGSSSTLGSSSSVMARATLITSIKSGLTAATRYC